MWRGGNEQCGGAIDTGEERAKDVREMDGLILGKGWEGRKMQPEHDWILLTTWSNVYPPVMMWERCWQKGVRNDIQTEAQHVWIWTGLSAHSLHFSGTHRYPPAPTFLHPCVCLCHFLSLITLICVYVYRMYCCVHVHASEIVIWGCWLGSEKKHDKCAKLVAGYSQTVKGGGMPAEDWGVGAARWGGLGAGRPCAATVTCRARHSSGRVAGGRGKHHPPGTVGEGAGWAGRLRSWRFLPRLYHRERIKRREIDLPPTIRVVAHSLFVCATDRENESYVLYEHKAVGFRFRMGGGTLSGSSSPLRVKCFIYCVVIL